MDLIGRTLGKNDWKLWEVDVTRIIVHPGYSKSGKCGGDDVIGYSERINNYILCLLLARLLSPFFLLV